MTEEQKEVLQGIIYRAVAADSTIGADLFEPNLAAGVAAARAIRNELTSEEMQKLVDVGLAGWACVAGGVDKLHLRYPEIHEYLQGDARIPTEDGGELERIGRSTSPLTEFEQRELDQSRRIHDEYAAACAEAPVSTELGAWYCQECGRKARSPEKAMSTGCTNCGGVDIQPGKPGPEPKGRVILPGHEDAPTEPRRTRGVENVAAELRQALAEKFRRLDSALQGLPTPGASTSRTVRLMALGDHVFWGLLLALEEAGRK